jgi:hypothetical protein
MSDANVNTTHAEPQVVHLEHSLEPARPEISDAIRKKHDVSKLRYPFLNLSEGEYVIASVRRHPIGLIGVLLVTAVLMVAASIFYGWYTGLATHPETIGMRTTDLPSAVSVFIPFVLFMILVALGGFIAAYVYLQNKFFLTNETVIQEIQTSLFSHREQIVSLSNIEDVGFSQSGILQMVFDYGSIRLSTIGDENTYRFSFVAAPKDQVARLNDTIEDFKNGRPVDVS